MPYKSGDFAFASTHNFAAQEEEEEETFQVKENLVDFLLQTLSSYIDFFEKEALFPTCIRIYRAQESLRKIV